MNNINVKLNFFGPHLKKKEIPKILDTLNTNPYYTTIRRQVSEFFELPFNALSNEILKRYSEVPNIVIVPHTPEIRERLLKPLRSAKKCYCLGDYTATIALCGTVGEMLTILLWKINDSSFKGKLITEKDEKDIFNNTFEKLGIERKLKILKAFGYITETQYSHFTVIRKSRNQYLHWWTIDLVKEQPTALDVFKKSFQLFNEITGIGLADARTVKINPLLMKLFDENNKKTT